MGRMGKSLPALEMCEQIIKMNKEGTYQPEEDNTNPTPPGSENVWMPAGLYDNINSDIMVRIWGTKYENELDPDKKERYKKYLICRQQQIIREYYETED